MDCDDNLFECLVAAGRADYATDYEPDYDAYIRETEALEEAMANVACYQDWFVEKAV